MRVAIIPARGGSRRIPRKNIRPFFGRPIVEYSIEAAKACGLFDHPHSPLPNIFVSSDDKEIRRVALDCGVWAIPRPEGLELDEVGTQEIVRASIGKDATEVCCIYPTAPLMTAKDVQLGYAAMLAGLPSTTYAYVEGWYYWGRAEYFGRVPLDDQTAVRLDVGERWIDINTEEDWVRAEEMYEKETARRLAFVLEHGMKA